MKLQPLLLLLTVLSVPGLPVVAEEEPVTRIAFGSCNRQDRDQPLWPKIAEFDPQVWIWLGDNIYGDSDDPEVLEAAWDRQKQNPGYTALRGKAEILGTWDDHDYGVNDGGKDYPIRAESQQLFLDFLDVPAGSPRRAQEGVYWAHRFGPEGRRVAILLLDIRYFRDQPGTDGDILGEAQWEWLEKQLAASDAQLHLIASGTQILPTEHRYEKWSQYPQSRKRLLELLAKHRVPGVLLLSGDRHIAEISRLDDPAIGYPLYEMTSSGLTHFYRNFPGEPNALRVGEVLADFNFGTIEIDWETGALRLAIRDGEGAAAREVKLGLEELQPPPGP